MVNGKEANNEDFIKPCAAGGGKCNLPDKITVPPDHYFMMGDNRGNSDDSRYWGPLDQDQIIGKAFFTYWPARPHRAALGLEPCRQRPRPGAKVAPEAA